MSRNRRLDDNKQRRPIMSNIVLAAAALAIGLVTSNTAIAAMPAGLAQSGAAARIEQSASGVEFIHMRRHHNRNGFRFFFGQQRNCETARSQFDYDRCRFKHRRHNHPRFFFNSSDQFDRRHAEPNFGFSILF
jgi:hypothetical protein